MRCVLLDGYRAGGTLLVSVLPLSPLLIQLDFDWLLDHFVLKMSSMQNQELQSETESFCSYQGYLEKS